MKIKELLYLTEENIADLLMDQIQRSGILNGEVLDDAEFEDENEFIIICKSGQKFYVTISEEV